MNCFLIFLLFLVVRFPSKYTLKFAYIWLPEPLDGGVCVCVCVCATKQYSMWVCIVAVMSSLYFQFSFHNRLEQFISLEINFVSAKIVSGEC